MRNPYDHTPGSGLATWPPTILPAPNRVAGAVPRAEAQRRSARGMAALALAVCAIAVPAAAQPAPRQPFPTPVRRSQAQAAAPAAPAPQQPARVLTLDDALTMAEESSEQITVAEAGVTRAQADERRARSEWFPQLSAFASYDRALASEFEGLFDSTGPGCTPFSVNPQAPLADRVSEIERALRDCPPTGSVFGGGSDSGGDSGSGSGSSDEDISLPFGRANTYRLNLAFSQNLYTGGRLAATRDRARVGINTAELGVRSSRAQVLLDVAEAFFNAVLSDRLLAIAEATLAQAEQTADQVRQQREAGRLAEFDQLRAQVTRDNQRPEVIRSRNARDLAYLRLKQLLELPLDQPLQLEANLEGGVLPVPASRLAQAVVAAESTPAPRPRTAVTQAENDVRQSEADIRIARSQRLPAVSLSSSYGRVAYPGTVPAWGDFRTNWTIGASAQVPIFTGGRLKADEVTARAGLTETQARLQLTRELATLDDASARLELTNARAAWEATSGTVQQATRAYEIAELRYREGLSTQLELSDARLLLQQAQTTRALAARAVQVARVRLALLPDLPLSSSGLASAQAVPQQAPAAAAQQAAPAAAGAQPGSAGVAGVGTTTGTVTGPGGQQQ